MGPLLVALVLTVTLIAFDPDSPPESVTFAVIVCDPAESVCEMDGPDPRCPSRLDVQTSRDEISPSSVSVADPENVTEVPYA